MKLFLSVFVAVCMFASSAMAFNQVISVEFSEPEKTKISEITGIVGHLSLADPARGKRSEIVVLNENGFNTPIIVKSTTTIYNSSWDAINLDRIEKQDKVRVRYSVTSEGICEAQSIRILK